MPSSASPDSSGDVPDSVRALAVRREAARRARDFAVADELRALIAAAGWAVTDTADGSHFVRLSTRTVLADIERVPVRVVDASPSTRRASIALVLEGWPDDVDACLDAVVDHAPPGLGVTVLDLGNVDGAGDRADDVAAAHPDLIDVVHVAASTAYGAARRALLHYDTAPIHVWMDTSTVVVGDAFTPILDAFDDPEVIGAGWRGVAVDDDWLTFHDVGTGPVEALLGYLFAMRTTAARTVAEAPTSPLRSARFYRNVDLEMSFALRSGGGRLVVPVADLPVAQQRHRGYHDSDPAYRDRESRRNYDHFLKHYRGRDDLRLPS